MTTALIDNAHDLDNCIKTLRQRTIKNLWGLIEYLQLARKQKIWEVLNYHSWSAYLAQPEIDLAEKTVDNYITTLNRFKEQDLLPPALLDVTKVREIAPHINKENYDKLVEKAQSLSRSDLREELKEMGYIEKPKQINEAEEEVLYTCPNCHFKFTKEDL
jgi:hypothetical protein